MTLDTTNRAAGIRVRDTLTRVIERSRLLADRDPAMLTAMDAFLGAMLQMRDNAHAHNFVMAALETVAEMPERFAQHEA